jgi:tetratricopeptide (TPR) repeat protein
LPTAEITGPQIPLNTMPPNTPPSPQSVPIKATSSRSTYSDLREETGMVLPHSAPAPEPNQRISKEFGKSVPGVTPVSKPFETAVGRERREAKEKAVEALNKIQLPAKVVPKPEETERTQEREAKPRDFNPPKEQAPKTKKQTDPGRAARFANLLHDSPGTGTGASKSLRASQSGGALPGLLEWLRSRWRLVIVAALVILLVLCVSALIVMFGKSLFGPMMSPSQKAGEEAYNDGNYDRAVNYFNEAIKAEQKKPALYHDRARANLRLQEYANAVADYTSALNLDKNFASARLDRAAAYYYLGDYMKSIADYDELLKNDPNNIDAYFGRGLSYSKLHKFEPALMDLKKVVEINPKHPGAFEDIANAYLAQNMFNEAVEAYSRSIKNNPRDANAYYMRATTYKRLGRTAEALNDFSSAIDVAPGRYEFYNDRGFTQYENSKFKEAIADLSTALELNPNYEIARHNRTTACDRIITAVGRTAKTPEELGDLAYAYVNLENYSGALAAANRALLLNSQYRPAMNIRAAIELKQRRFDYALTDADNILKLKTDDKDALLTRARAYLHLGRYEKAIKDYDACVAENDNTSLFALRERALAHLLANEGALAATDAQQFLDINGWNNSLSGPTVLLSWLAKRQLQDLDGANAVLSQAETHLKASQWPYAVIKFLKRELTLAQLNSIAHNDRERTDVRIWSAYDHVLNGLRDEARADFNWVKRSGYQDNDDYLLATEQIRSDDSGGGR